MALHTDSPDMGGYASNLAYQSMDGPGGASPRAQLLKTSSQEVQEAIGGMVSSAAKGLDAAIAAMSQTGDQSVLPKVFPSQAFRLRWLVDLNGTWRGVESQLYVGVAGVRLTQVVLTTPGQNGKIGGVTYKEIGAWKYGGILEWGASDSHLLIACKTPALPRAKDYILETTQAEEIVARIKQHVVVATIAELPEQQVKQRLALMAAELDQMMTMKTEMAQVKRALGELHADTVKAREKNEERQLQLEVEQQRRREIATTLHQIAQDQRDETALVDPKQDLLAAFGVKPEDLSSPAGLWFGGGGKDVASTASEITRRLSICSLNSSIGSALNASIDAPSINGSLNGSILSLNGSLDGSLDPPAIVDEATQSVVVQSLLLTAQSLQSEGETSAAQHILRRVDTMMAVSAMSPPVARRPSIGGTPPGTPERRRNSIVSMSVEAGEHSLEVGDKLVSQTSLNSSVGGEASLEPLDEEGVRDSRGQKAAAARAHKKKTAAQLFGLLKTEFSVLPKLVAANEKARLSEQAMGNSPSPRGRSGF